MKNDNDIDKIADEEGNQYWKPGKPVIIMLSVAECLMVLFSYYLLAKSLSFAERIYTKGLTIPEISRVIFAIFNDNIIWMTIVSLLIILFFYFKNAFLKSRVVCFLEMKILCVYLSMAALMFSYIIFLSCNQRFSFFMPLK